jgi:hypothetical protein
MKADIHPNYHMIKVVMTNGEEFATRSTYGEDGATLDRRLAAIARPRRPPVALQDPLRRPRHQRQEVRASQRPFTTSGST